MVHEAIVSIEGLSKSYGETRALIDATLSFRAGEVHALMGENGSGKSTLVKLISGIVQPTAGRILMAGDPVAFPLPRDAIQRGIGTIHQDSALVPQLTVAQNIMLGHEPRTMPGVLGRGGRRAAVRWLDEIQADIDPDVVAGDLSIAARQLVAIAKALSNESALLLFDEPTAALGETETAHLLRQIDSLRARGIGIVYISHRIAEVRRLADRLSVLKDGRLTYTGSDDLDEDAIIRLMIGREPDALFPVLAPAHREILLQARGLQSAAGEVAVGSFTLRRGEVVGIAGLDGSGRDRVARLLAGVERPAVGDLTVDGVVLRDTTPAKAVRAGISFVPPDRRRQAVIDDFSVAATITQSAVRRFSRWSVLRRRAEAQAARSAADEMGVKSADLGDSILTLSGGNQQKAVLARTLVAGSKVMICDEPTAGVDVGARADIYGRFAELAAAGLGIILSSSDMVELIGMCHRVVVVREGRISADFTASEVTEEKIMAAQLPQSLS